ncbi:MAG: single-stranded DNA-binding protein [Acholeplasmataceae bacterium]|jgi:single-strand DNA-binding protein|nr:single-stranded DNA-binding protein [Acholeplasmataceae bacterium]MCK9233550.1 single-stranded DNA-binding protein [Acholeplasmataceae bacterium]MCK9288806.1 single-stranded DNA-binding protein [Acholeplasmataceae bacterium]MCK9427288.1 single-stranded DNA-binding protein [Acholeplasmataceae bacterium]HHT39131.1 single-stranded DNA-binding protein [Acholeplasmataceae bacterium]
MNRVVLVGRITRDPELRYTQSNIAVVSFTIAINRQFLNAQGEQEADFINCVVWRKQAENLAKFVRKGAQLGVDGRLQSRTYQTQTGETRYVTEVVADSIQFLEPKGQTSTEYQPEVEENPFDDENIDVASDDDLPF